MTALELLADLTAKGVRLEPRRGRLRYSAPPGALTPILKETITEKKPALIQALRNPRRAAREAWHGALAAVADAWDRHALEARAAGRKPTEIYDDLLTSNVRVKILAIRGPEDLAPALEAVETWRRTWETAMEEAS
jgi:hypothetical protein